MTKLTDRISQILNAFKGKEFSYNDAHQILRANEPNISPANTNFTLNNMKKSGSIEPTIPGKMKIK